LARGADLKCIGERTVAIVPHGADLEGKQVPHISVRLIFDEDGQLAERRVVQAPGEKTVRREVYDRNGTIRHLDAPGKEFRLRQGALRPAAAPDLVPDISDLVVLPLPYRTRDHVRQVFRIGEKKLEDLDTDAALALFAAEFAGRNSFDALQLFGRRF